MRIDEQIMNSHHSYVNSCIHTGSTRKLPTIVKRKMVSNSININKTNNHSSPCIIKHTKYHDTRRHENVAVLNRITESQPSPPPPLILAWILDWNPE